MIKIKNTILVLMIIIIAFIAFTNIDKIKEKIYEVNKEETKKLTIPPSNKYTKDTNYISFQQVNDYVPNNYSDLLNIFYSILNQGWEEFTFYCPEDYTNCINDVEKLSYDKELLSDMNNFVHPYNSYSSIRTLYDETGEITVKINHLYSNEEIKKLDPILNEIINNNINNTMTDNEKILAMHDYIVNNTKYDVERTTNGSTAYDSTRISGVLLENYGICSGYTDTMSALLDKLNIPNFRISSATHVWNAVYINNQWVHLDLTWDDPVTPDLHDAITHDYFLINNEQLMELDENQEHVFKKDVYLEFNN